jgi:hypothetical protein
MQDFKNKRPVEDNKTVRMLQEGELSKGTKKNIILLPV